MKARAVPALVLVAIFVATGCGGSTHAATSTRITATTATTQSGREVLVRAARSAVSGNFRLSLWVLWNNRIPRWATQSTRGPALTSLRSSAAERRKQGIRIRSQSGRYTVQRLKLDPSYTRATALVHDVRHVVPYRAGKRLGRAIAVDERAQIELRRLGNTNRFVVWRITPAR